ncbi:sensor domain-containing diguanylate cyclase [Acinetobacter sp. UBA6720]|uniref:sensor domain-containing diguanylate cyclase n=1 Tax=Acinetobacter sp. UBA6720 TaxID=1945953 RepID=UPI0025C05673|nr:diguanylate cyclase [Acinetobacter sp. UBA6720]
MSQDFEYKKPSLTELNSLMTMAIQQSFNAIVITDASFEKEGPNIIFCNPAFCKMTGYSENELIGQSPRILQGHDTDPAVIHELKRCLIEGKFFHNNTINYRKDKTAYHVEWNISPIKNEFGKITHFVSVQRDISEKNENLKYQTMLIATINTTPDTIVITDDQAKIQFINHATETLSGYTFADLKDEPITKLYPSNQQLIEIRKIKKQKVENTCDAEDKNDHSEKHFLDLISSPLKDHNGKITHYVSIGRNINHHIQLKSQLEEWANYDSLTNIFNRRYGERLLDTLQKDMCAEDNSCCVLLADIDYFKTINDSYGHALGDAVLQQVINELSKNLRSRDTLIRWGGDEILIVLSDIKLVLALKMAERLRTVIASCAFPVVQKVTMSFGVVAWKRKELKKSVLHRADEQLYISKRNGRNCISPKFPP